MLEKERVVLERVGAAERGTRSSGGGAESGIGVCREKNAKKRNAKFLTERGHNPITYLNKEGEPTGLMSMRT